MFPTWWRKKASSKPTRRKPSRRLHVEALEARFVMATHTWTGAVNTLWSNDGNWLEGAPVPNESTPIDLIFPTNATAAAGGTVTSVNDLFVAEFVFIDINSIRFTGANADPSYGNSNDQANYAI